MNVPNFMSKGFSYQDLPGEEGEHPPSTHDQTKTPWGILHSH